MKSFLCMLLMCSEQKVKLSLFARSQNVAITQKYSVPGSTQPEFLDYFMFKLPSSGIETTFCKCVLSLTTPYLYTNKIIAILKQKFRSFNLRLHFLSVIILYVFSSISLGCEEKQDFSGINTLFALTHFKCQKFRCVIQTMFTVSERTNFTASQMRNSAHYRHTIILLRKWKL